MKKIYRVLVSLVFAAVLFGVLFAQLQQTSGKKIEYIEVVQMKEKVVAGAKIGKEDVVLKEVPVGVIKNGITDLTLVIDKYARNTLYPEDYVRNENVKTVGDNVISPRMREVRIPTNIAAYGGVGKGDKIDLIYIGKINMVMDPIGEMIEEGLEVKSVLNKAGVDLELVSADKYNQTDLEPGYVTFLLDQKRAIEIEVLQGLQNDVSFKLVKWVEQSEATEEEHGILRKNQILGIPEEYQQEVNEIIQDRIGNNVRTSGNGEIEEIGGDGK